MGYYMHTMQSAADEAAYAARLAEFVAIRLGCGLPANGDGGC
jgi:hypothetical protein